MISFQVFYRIRTRLQLAVQHRGLEPDLTSVSRSFLGLIQSSGRTGDSGKAGIISAGEVLAKCWRQPSVNKLGSTT